MWLCGGQLCYLLILICCDGGEHSLGEGEGAGAFPSGDSSHWGQLLSALLADYMNPRLVFVHGVQNDLSREGQKILSGLHYITAISCYSQL